jgi:putative addiction module component (TIGR02574 family)
LFQRTKEPTMPTPIEIVEAEAMKLTPRERADLADKLWVSAHSAEEVDAAWEAEIARRIQQIDSGEVECIPWETVMAEMRAKFG